jgi:hypothetical protein
MPTHFVPHDAIRISELFDGRLAAMGIVEIIDDEVDYRYLSDKDNCIQVYSTPSNYVAFFTQGAGEPGPIFSAIEKMFGVTIRPGPEHRPRDAGDLPEEYYLGLLKKASKQAVAAAELIAARSITRFAKQSLDPERFITAALGSKTRIIFKERTWGIRTMYEGQKVIAIRDEAISQIAANLYVAAAIPVLLRRQGLLIEGKRRGTVRLPVTIRLPGDCNDEENPNFWVINYDLLTKCLSKNTLPNTATAGL